MNKELLSAVKEMSFHELLNLYVEAKSGAPKNLDVEISPVDRELVNRVEEIIEEIIAFETEPL